MITATQKFTMHNFEQGSTTWIEWRRWAVTASDIVAIAGMSEWSTREQVMEQKLLNLAPAENYAMRRGTRLEPVARRRFEAVKRKDFPACCVTHAEKDWMRASLDGLSLDYEIVEIKAPNWKIHESALMGFVPVYYMAQIQWQLLVTGVASAYFVTISEHKNFPPVDQLAIVQIGPDTEFQARLYEEGKLFYEELMARKEDN